MHISKLPEDQFKKLSFIEDSFLLFRGNVDNTQVMHKVSKQDFEKIQKLLAKDADVNVIKPKSKVFLLPNSTFKQSVIKEVCKKLELKIVTDVSRADIIISNSNLSEHCEWGEAHKMSSYLINKVTVSKYTTCHYSEVKLNKFLADSRVQLSCKNYLEQIANLSIETVCFNILGKGPVEMYDYDYHNDSYSSLITDDCAEVVYSVLKKSLPIIQDKTLFNSIEKVVIDKDYFETISMMLNGSSDDKNLAFEILYNCDINKSYYYLIKLVSKHHYDFFYRKGKNTKFHKALLNELTVTEDQEYRFIEELTKRGSLTEEIYNQLSHKALKEAIRSFNYHNDLKLFDLQVNIKSYEDYMNQITTQKENV